MRMQSGTATVAFMTTVTLVTREKNREKNEQLLQNLKRLARQRIDTNQTPTTARTPWRKTLKAKKLMRHMPAGHALMPGQLLSSYCGIRSSAHASR